MVMDDPCGRIGDELISRYPIMCNISNYTNRILETLTYLTGGISLPKVFPILQSREHCPTKTQESYVATKNRREKNEQVISYKLSQN